jgi:hypothetical protein
LQALSNDGNFKRWLSEPIAQRPKMRQDNSRFIEQDEARCARASREE